MQFRDDSFGDAITVFVLEDEHFVRRFSFRRDLRVIHERVSLKKGRGRPFELAMWFHRDDEAARMYSVLERYQLKQEIEDVGAPKQSVHRL